jgi:hypothetical protein
MASLGLKARNQLHPHRHLLALRLALGMAMMTKKSIRMAKVAKQLPHQPQP